MKQKSLSVIALCLVLAFATAAPAQSTAAAPFGREICTYYGYAWTFSQSYGYYSGINYNSGEVDVADKPIWGLSLDIPVRPGMWAELLYSNQSSDLTFESNATGLQTIDELSINYWQIGGVQALEAGGKVVPFTSLSLGATYVTAKEADTSKTYVSMILGVGTGGASVGFYGTGVTQFDLSAGAFVSFKDA